MKVRNYWGSSFRKTATLSWAFPPGVPPGFYIHDLRKIFLWFWQKEKKSNPIKIYLELFL